MIAGTAAQRPRCRPPTKLRRLRVPILPPRSSRPSVAVVLSQAQQACACYLHQNYSSKPIKASRWLLLLGCCCHCLLALAAGCCYHKKSSLLLLSQENKLLLFTIASHRARQQAKVLFFFVSFFLSLHVCFDDCNNVCLNKRRFSIKHVIVRSFN